MKQKNGFTLMELLIVILILAILAGIGVFRYNKTIDENRVRKDINFLKMVGAARRVQIIDNGKHFDDRFTSSMTISCPSTGVSDIDTAGELIGCGYLEDYDWDDIRSRIFTCDINNPTMGGCCISGNKPAGEDTIACMWKRPIYRTGDASDGWEFFYTATGKCYSYPSDEAPSCGGN